MPLEPIMPGRVVRQRFDGDAAAAEGAVQDLMNGTGFLELVRWCEQNDDWDRHNKSPEGMEPWSWSEYLHDNPDVLLATAIRYVEFRRRREDGGSVAYLDDKRAEDGVPGRSRPTKIYTAQELAAIAYSDDSEAEEDSEADVPDD
jgi:hypothetical protein